MHAVHKWRANCTVTNEARRNTTPQTPFVEEASTFTLAFPPRARLPVLFALLCRKVAFGSVTRAAGFCMDEDDRV